MFRHLDSDSYSGVMGHFLNGLSAAFPETEGVLQETFNSAIQNLGEQTLNQCALETILRHGYQPSSGYTQTGQFIPELLENEPALAPIIQQFELGHRAPSVPILLGTSDIDDVVPAEEVRRLAADWCAQGATLETSNPPLPLLPLGSGAGHFATAAVLYLGQVRNWLRERFKDVAASSNCPT